MKPLRKKPLRSLQLCDRRLHDEPACYELARYQLAFVHVFVLRAAAVALGQIKNRAGTAALISALSNEKLPSDVRREAARSLGLIGDPSAAAALRAASTAADPFLAEIAHQALRKLSRG